MHHDASKILFSFILLTVGAFIAPTPSHAEEKPLPIPAPTLNIPIPNLNFTQDITHEKGETVTIPWLAEYMAAAYQYLVGVGIIIAVIIMMIGGVQWMTAAGTGRVAQAKEKLQRATMGLFLLLGSYIILFTINPDTLTFQPLILDTVIEAPYKEELSEDAYKAITGQPLPKITSAAKAAMIKSAGELANQAGLPRCLAQTLAKFESGGNPAVIGHDENFPRPTRIISSRIRFLHAGKTFLGKSFKSTGISYNVAKQQLKGLSGDAKTEYLKTVQVSNHYNDDGGRHANLSAMKKPNYGIDWRYTHGFGVGQITCGGSGKPECMKNGGGGCKVAGKCFTVPELLTVEGGLAAKIERLKIWYKKPCWGVPGGTLNTPQEQVDEKIIRKTIANWGAGCTSSNPKTGANAVMGIPWATTRQQRIDTYKSCIANGGTLTP